MTEEEKKAIDILKDFAENEDTKYCYDWQGFDYETILGAIECLLNLIDKQQKEIDQLANVIRVLGTNPDITTEEIIKEFTEKPISEEYMKKFKSSYISKNKIKKELLEPISKEKQEVYKDFIEKSKADYFGIEGSVLQELNWVVGTIKDLLEE